MSVIVTTNVTKFAFEFDNVRTSKIFDRFEIRCFVRFVIECEKCECEKS